MWKYVFLETGILLDSCLTQIRFFSFSSLLPSSCSVSGLSETISKKNLCHFSAVVLSLDVRVAYTLLKRLVFAMINVLTLLWSQISFSVTVLWHCLVSEVEAEQDNPISSSFSAAWYFSKFISGTGEWFPASFKVSVLQRVNGRLWSECVSDSCLLKAEYHLCVNTSVQMDMVLVTSLWNVLLDSTLPGNKTQISIDLAFDFR